MALLLLALLLPTLAAADVYQPGDNILLSNGVPYGNYGYTGLVALYDGDMDAVDGHMRSKHSNQQGAGEERPRAVPVAAALVRMTYEEMKAYLLAGLLAEDIWTWDELDMDESGSFVNGIWQGHTIMSTLGGGAGSYSYVWYSDKSQIILSNNNGTESVSFTLTQDVATLSDFLDKFRGTKGYEIWYPY